jgi:hypothetical protein
VVCDNFDEYFAASSNDVIMNVWTEVGCISHARL